MSTTRYNLPNDGWIKLVSAEFDEFLLENETFAPILITITPEGETPSNDAPGHRLRGGEAFVRIAPGDVYARSVDIESAAVVTVG